MCFAVYSALSLSISVRGHATLLFFSVFIYFIGTRTHKYFSTLSIPIFFLSSHHSLRQHFVNFHDLYTKKYLLFTSRAITRALRSKRVYSYVMHSPKPHKSARALFHKKKQGAHHEKEKKCKKKLKKHRTIIIQCHKTVWARPFSFSLFNIRNIDTQHRAYDN